MNTLLTRNLHILADIYATDCKIREYAYKFIIRASSRLSIGSTFLIEYNYCNIRATGCTESDSPSPVLLIQVSSQQCQIYLWLLNSS